MNYLAILLLNFFQLYLIKYLFCLTFLYDHLQAHSSSSAFLLGYQFLNIMHLSFYISFFFGFFFACEFFLVFRIWGFDFLLFPLVLFSGGNQIAFKVSVDLCSCQHKNLTRDTPVHCKIVLVEFISITRCIWCFLFQCRLLVLSLFGATLSTALKFVVVRYWAIPVIII
jgi:hypothetical protein